MLAVNEITKEYLEEVDKNTKHIFLTSDWFFKALMRRNADILEYFLIDLMNLDISDEDSIVFLDKELILR